MVPQVNLKKKIWNKSIVISWNDPGGYICTLVAVILIPQNELLELNI